MAQLIQSYLKDEALQREIRRAKENGTSASFDVWWLGQSGFLLQWNGLCLLFDPYLSDSLTQKYASTKKPHVRMSERVIDPRRLNFVDVVTSSHNHTDHLDAETLKPLLEVNPEISFVIPEANRAFVQQRLGCNMDFPIGLKEGQSKQVKGFTFHGLPSAHNEIERDEKGQCKFMGFVITFGEFCVYHSGDTLWYEGLEKRLEKFKLDVVFLPINGNDPQRGVAGNLDASEAARLAKMIGARFVIPHHYNMFTFNTANPADFVRHAEEIGQAYSLPRHGERMTFSV